MRDTVTCERNNFVNLPQRITVLATMVVAEAALLGAVIAKVY